MCRLHYCCKPLITLDGYCFKHKHYSDEEKYIIEHISKYLSYIEKSLSFEIKLMHIIKMFHYLKYKKKFINNNLNFKNVVEKKMIEFNEYLNANDSLINEELKSKSFEVIKLYEKI